MNRPPRIGNGPRSGGSFAALPTPVRAGRVDQDSLARLGERQIGRGTAALVVCVAPAPIRCRMAS